MSSIRSQIIAAMKSALDAPEKPTGLSVHRTKTRPITADKLPAIVIYRLQEPTERRDGRFGEVAERQLHVRCECRVKLHVDEDALDDALDSVTSWAVQALMADPTLGGLAENIQEVNTNWVAAEANQVYGAALLDFAVTYQTLAADPDTID